MPPDNHQHFLLQEFSLVGLRNLKIKNRLIISCLISTVFPLFFIYLYTYSLYESSEISGQILVIALLMMGVSLTMTLYTYLSISHPIDHMIKTCQAISEGDLERRIKDHASDELAYLSDNIDSMVTEIQLLLEESQKSDAKKRELELRMLQYQINPHFLFNTLNTLRFVAQMNQDKVVSEGIRSLSELLKNTLINDREFITIKEEIDNLKHYFSIQSIRYAGSFHVNYMVDETILDYLLPKLLLQPLAENSVLHGSFNDGTIMEIHVRAYMDKTDVLLEVEDKGKGFSNTKGANGIGNKNVNDRIHLYFPGSYGLIVKSHPGEGTLNRIRIPAILSDTEMQKIQGGTYVSGTDC